MALDKSISKPSPPIDVKELCLSYPFDWIHFEQKGFCPRKNLRPVKLQIPVNWAQDPFNDRNWCFQLHAWRMNAPYIRAYDSTKEVIFLNKAFEFCKDWWRFHSGVQGKNDTPFSWGDMAVGLRAMQVAFFMNQHDLGHLDLCAQDVKLLKKIADAHVAILSRKSFLKLNNHGLFQAYGLKLLTEVLGIKQDRADEFLRVILKTQFTEEGVHRENSPEYHYMVTNVVRRLAKWGRFPDDTRRLVKSAVNATQAMVNGAGHLPQVGDTSVKSGPCLPINSNIRVHDLSKSGYIMVKKGRSSLFFSGMAHSYTHKHADELSFELVHNGIYVFIDAGKYGYEKNKWRKYITSAAAHNTVSILGEDLPVKSVPLSGSLIQKPIRQGDKVSMRGEICRSGLYTQRRQLVYQPQRSLHIADRITSSENRTFISTLMLAPNLVPEIGIDGFRVFLENGWIATVKTNAGSMEAICGDEQLLLGWCSPEYNAIQKTWIVRAISSGMDVYIEWGVKLEKPDNRVGS